MKYVYRASFFWVMVMVLLQSTVVTAGRMKAVPGITLRQEYSDNIDYAVKEEKSDFRTIVIPELKLRDRTERLDILLKGLLRGYYYRTYDQYDNYDQKYTGEVDYRMSERLIAGFQGKFQIDTQADREIDETGLVFDTRKRYSSGGSTGITYMLSEKTVLRLTGSYTDYRFDSDDYVNSWIANVNASFTTNLSRWVSNAIDRTNIAYSRYDYGDTKVDNYNITKGVSWRISERSEAVIDLGGRYTRYTQQIYSVEETSGYWGWVGQLTYNRNYETMSWEMNASRTMENAGGRTNASIRTALNGVCHIRLAETMSCRANISYFLNETEYRYEGVEDGKETAWRGALAWVYGLTKDISAQVQYAYSRTTDTFDNRINRHVVGIQVSYHLPLGDE